MTLHPDHDHTDNKPQQGKEAGGPADQAEASVAAGLETARRLIAKPAMTAMSFDIFDTFLLRQCTAPDGVYERAFHHLPIAATRFGLAESFVQHRVLAEHRARIAAVEAGQGGEVTIADIYRRFPRHCFGLTQVPVDALVEAEFQAELDLCRVNPEILALLQTAQAQGLKTGFISDTYWSAEKLTTLLQRAAPGLRYDFLYASCEHGTNKAGKLLQVYLAQEKLEGRTAIHIGDNYVADILGAQACGIEAIHYPQAHQRMMPTIMCESLAAQLLRSKRADFSHRLDDGLMTVRRTALARMPQHGQAELSTAAILGPVLAGFQRFIEERRAEIAAPGRRAAILFLGRDGFLPMAAWLKTGSLPASYVEINRRVCLVGCLNQIEPLQKIFRTCSVLNAPTVDAILKVSIPSLHAYFAKQPDGMVSGQVLAEELPALLTGDDVAAFSRSMRQQILTYLRLTIPDFDRLTDLILVDLGYNGTIQKCLRGIFDQEGLPHRLHGTYMLSADDAMAELPEGDSVAGFIDDGIVTPIIKRYLLRNIALLEQFCSAPVGSVALYDGGRVQHEVEIRPAAQLALCGRIQRACLDFVQLMQAASAELAIDPMQDMVTMRSWSAVLLARLLLFPTLAEQTVFGPIKHDVNLGTYVLHDLINTEETEPLLGALPLTAVWQADAPPMWAAGNSAAISSLNGCAYGVAAFGLPIEEVLHEQVVTHLPASLIKDGKGQSCAASCTATATGELRLRIPVHRAHTGSMLALPLERFLQRGMIRSIGLQRGDGSADAGRSQQIETVSIRDLQGLSCQIDGSEFRALGQDAHLLLPIAESDRAVTIVTLTILPLPPIFENEGSEDESTGEQDLPVLTRGAA